MTTDRLAALTEALHNEMDPLPWAGNPCGHTLMARRIIASLEAAGVTLDPQPDDHHTTDTACPICLYMREQVHPAPDAALATMGDTDRLAALLHLFTCGARREHDYDFDDDGEKQPMCVSAALLLANHGVTLDPRPGERDDLLARVVRLPYLDHAKRRYVERVAVEAAVRDVLPTGRIEKGSAQARPAPDAALREAAQAVVTCRPDFRMTRTFDLLVDALRAALEADHD